MTLLKDLWGCAKQLLLTAVCCTIVYGLIEAPLRVLALLILAALAVILLVLANPSRHRS